MSELETAAKEGSNYYTTENKNLTENMIILPYRDTPAINTISRSSNLLFESDEDAAKRKMDSLITKVKKYVKRYGFKENLGQKEVREYEEWLNKNTDLSHIEKHTLSSELDRFVSTMNDSTDLNESIKAADDLFDKIRDFDANIVFELDKEEYFEALQMNNGVYDWNELNITHYMPLSTLQDLLNDLQNY